MTRAEPRRIRIDLAYDGTDFAGWQRQRRQRTVQGVVERTLSAIQGAGYVQIRGAGRTDAGVHARGQVADCRIRSRLDDDRLQHALVRLLPPDVRPLRVRTVEDGFHSQKAAQAKTYSYRLDLSPHGDPLRARFALHHPQAVDEALVGPALRSLLGRHDWSGFTSTACTVKQRVRELRAAEFHRAPAGQASFTFSGNGFLRYMVRNLVGTVLRIGRRRMEPERILRIFATGDRSLAGPTAPAHGLCLERIVYGDECRMNGDDGD